MGKEHLGAGWSFPVALTPDGEVAVSSYEEGVRQAVWIILGTAPGERMMRPDFGCGIHRYVFSPADVRTLGQIRFQVEDSLRRWEPRIELDRVEVEPAAEQEGQLLIRIDYRVKATDSRFNLVYPFYLGRGEVR